MSGRCFAAGGAAMHSTSTWARQPGPLGALVALAPTFG